MPQSPRESVAASGAPCDFLDVWVQDARQLAKKYGFSMPEGYYVELAASLARRYEAGDAAHAALRRKHESQRAAQKIILDLIAQGNSKGEAAHAAGISIDTLYRWRRENPLFRAELAKAQGVLAELGTRTIRQYRPAKMTAGVRDEIVRRLREGATRGEAASAAGVSRQTLYNWLQRMQDFASAVVAAEDVAARRAAGI